MAEIEGWEAVCERFPFTWLQDAMLEHAEGLEEVALDLGQPVRIRTGSGRVVVNRVLERREIERIADAARFREDGRAGIEGTLHRVSRLTNARGIIVGVRLRIGRFVPGVADAVMPYLERDPSCVLVGVPGGGKTTLLRGIAQRLGRLHTQNCVVVDSSGEICGEGDAVHPALGLVTRLQVVDASRQEVAFMEAVRNCSPEVIVGDEVGYASDVEMVSTIARRGTGVIVTVHGRGLDDVMQNAALSMLLGDYDRLAKRRHSSAPMRQLIHVLTRGVYRVYTNLDEAVDVRARGGEPKSDLVGPLVGAFLERHPEWAARCRTPSPRIDLAAVTA
jgi:stage III sporulation protein SpoIIIAA